MDDLVSDLYSENSHSRGNSSVYRSPALTGVLNGGADDIPEIRLNVEIDDEFYE